MFITWTKLVRPPQKTGYDYDQDGSENLKKYVPLLDNVEKYGKVLVEILKGSLFYIT